LIDFLVCYCGHHTATAIAVVITSLLLAIPWYYKHHFDCCLVLLMPSSLPLLDGCIVAGHWLIVASFPMNF